MDTIGEHENVEGGNKGSGLGEGSEGGSVGGTGARALAAVDGASSLARLPDRSLLCLPSADAVHRLFCAHWRANILKRVCTPLAWQSLSICFDSRGHSLFSKAHKPS